MGSERGGGADQNTTTENAKISCVLSLVQRSNSHNSANSLNIFTKYVNAWFINHLQPVKHIHYLSVFFSSVNSGLLDTLSREASDKMLLAYKNCFN